MDIISTLLSIKTASYDIQPLVEDIITEFGYYINLSKRFSFHSEIVKKKCPTLHREELQVKYFIRELSTIFNRLDHTIPVVDMITKREEIMLSGGAITYYCSFVDLTEDMDVSLVYELNQHTLFIEMTHHSIHIAVVQTSEVSFEEVNDIYPDESYEEFTLLPYSVMGNESIPVAIYQNQMIQLSLSNRKLMMGVYEYEIPHEVANTFLMNWANPNQLAEDLYHYLTTLTERRDSL